MALLSLLISLFLALYLGKGVLAFWSRFIRSVAIIQNYPGLRLLVNPHSLLAFLPRMPYINIGEQYSLRYGHSLFSSRGQSDVISLVAFFPPTRSFILADPVAIKHITADRNRYTKPTYMYRALTQFGMNLAVAEGDVWRRHRKIIAGSFTEKTNELAWEETTLMMSKLLQEWSTTTRVSADGKQEVFVESAVDLTLKITLFVVSAAAFSHRPPWNDDEPDQASAGQAVSFRVALHGILDGALVRVMTPAWAYKLPIKRLHHIKACYTSCDYYLASFIAERKRAGTHSDLREDENGRRDLLGALCYASAPAEEGDKEMNEMEGYSGEGTGREKKRCRLTDEEVMGNMYVFLLAGHETTAHTLALAFALLALYPAEQATIHAKIDEAFPLGHEPNYADYPKLAFVRATFLETLRLYPMVAVIPKYATADSMIPTAPGEDGTPAENIFVPKWTELLLDSVALQRNPRYWGEDADDFKPSRFIDRAEDDYKWPRDAFLGFSAGHRACPGKGFGTVEGVAVLAFILRKYSVHLAEDLDGTGEKRRRKGETFAEKVKRVMQVRSVITLTPGPTPVVFRLR